MKTDGVRDPGGSGGQPLLSRTITTAAACCLAVILVFGILLKPYLDSTGPTESSPLDVLRLIAAGSPARLPLDSWEPMMRAFAWLHRHPGGNVYEAIFFTEHVKFQYPLTSFLPMELMSSLGLLHLRVYALLNLVLTVATGIGMGILLVDLAKWLDLPGPSGSRSTRMKLAGLGVLATLGFFPVVKAFSIGQMQVWLNAAFVFSAILYLRDRRGAVGVLLGLSTLIKPQLSLFLLWALLRRDWRMAGGWALVVGIGTAAAAALYGVRPMLTYLDVLSFIGRHGEGYYSNQTLNGLLNRLLGNGNNAQWLGDAFAPYHPIVHAATLLSGLLFVAFGLLWRRHDRGPGGILSFTLAGVCFTVGSPVAWIHHYGILLPAFAVALLLLVRTAADDPPAAARGYALLGLAYLLTSVDAFKLVNALADTPFNLLQSYFLVGTLLLIGVLWRTGAHLRPLAELVPPAGHRPLVRNAVQRLLFSG
ncbi:glycosyltransferase family 87 protein [Azospirillum picis]|uniref:DUF2029 domain-containing protein n=1 Tax=Azospirillum picis TaxID=488438 RepID=A0ABU0MJF4_9PROT|nr:glycosyltransferase family 87 protein [Azospirillum picis]MBP2299794.1 hypothetical protein [Azospirillum picis]MDQ0533590.1 hypothetical protein [Azospirillum picis]